MYRGIWFYIGGCTEGCGSIQGGVQRDVVLYRGVYRGMWFYIVGVYRGMWFYIGDVQWDVALYRGCTEGCGSI